MYLKWIILEDVASKWDILIMIFCINCKGYLFIIISGGDEEETKLLRSKLFKKKNAVYWISGVPRKFFSGGVQQIQLRTEDRENGDLGVVAP